MAGGQKRGPEQPARQGLTRQQRLAVLVPVGGLALLVVLVILFVNIAGPAKVSAKTMPFDGSNGSADDPDLKDLGGGLKYRDLKVGDGEEVPPGATVTIHYVGWVADTGVVFDSSRDKGQPATFPLGQLIPGWQQGIPGMRVGGVRKLVIPPELGYGSMAKGKIPANSTLIFEIELSDFSPGGMPGFPGGLPPGHPPTGR